MHAQGLAIVEFRVWWPARVVNVRLVPVRNIAADGSGDRNESKEGASYRHSELIYF